MVLELFFWGMLTAKNRGIRLSPNAKTERRVRELTLHKAKGAKGLQAKVVFILNVIKDIYGFPSEIEDSSIFEPARENYSLQESKEEERRLFYVVMTRAMDDLYIYTWEPSVSEFIEEISDYAVKVENLTKSGLCFLLARKLTCF